MFLELIKQIPVFTIEIEEEDKVMHERRLTIKKKIKKIWYVNKTVKGGKGKRVIKASYMLR